MLPLIGILVGVAIVGRLANRIVGPKKYTVCVVGDATDPSYKDLMEQVFLQHFNSDLDGVPLETEILNDDGDPDKADRIAEDLQNRPDVLMVVGHGLSSTSQRALRHYLQSDPPIPVILTTETNPRLYDPPTPSEDRLRPVFRLFPTDENQAAVAADFIANKGAKSVWVVVDPSNPTYSQYLAREFLKDVYERHPSLKVLLWSDYTNLPPNAIDQLGIEWVFFAGEWRDALLLVRQLSKLQKTNKAKVLLSDGSADRLLLEQGGADVAGVYVLHPLAADVFSKYGYKLVGSEAYQLASDLTDNVHQQFSTLARCESPFGYTLRQWLGWHRVGDARLAIARYMTTAVHNEIPFSSSGVEITMMQDEHRAVVRKDASFHIWRIDQCNGYCKFVEPAY